MKRPHDVGTRADRLSLGPHPTRSIRPSADFLFGTTQVNARHLACSPFPNLIKKPRTNSRDPRAFWHGQIDLHGIDGNYQSLKHMIFERGGCSIGRRTIAIPAASRDLRPSTCPGVSRNQPRLSRS